MWNDSRSETLAKVRTWTKYLYLRIWFWPKYPLPTNPETGTNPQRFDIVPELSTYPKLCSSFRFGPEPIVLVCPVLSTYLQVWSWTYCPYLSCFKYLPTGLVLNLLYWFVLFYAPTTGLVLNLLSWFVLFQVPTYRFGPEPIILVCPVLSTYLQVWSWTYYPGLSCFKYLPTGLVLNLLSWFVLF